jgi:pimeloyl-ACP methyl ester carboxylesterase
VIDVFGQRKLFYDRVREAGALPPARLFWGEQDTLIPIAHGRALVEAMHGVRLEAFADCGHYVHQQQPERFATSLLAFLDDPTVPPARLLPEPQPSTACVTQGFARGPRTAF